MRLLDRAGGPAHFTTDARADSNRTAESRRRCRWRSPERHRHESAGKVCLDWEHRFSPVYSLHSSMASLGSVCFLLPVAFHLCESFHDIARAVMFSVELEFPMRIVLTAVDVMYLLYWFILFIYVHFECFLFFWFILKRKLYYYV